MALGIVISTPGRASLARTLQSIYYQREPVADVMVVADGHHQPTKELCGFFADLGLPVRYVATEKTRDWGHSQVNYGLQHVKGDYVCYQDDDDVFLPRALEEMDRLVTSLDPPRPLLGRVKTPRFGLLWQRPDVTTCLDGHCLVAPNDKKRLGYMTSEYNGDQGLIHTTLRNYEQYAWCDRIWTLTRPKWTLQTWRQEHAEGVWRWRFEREGTGVQCAVLEMEKIDNADAVMVSLPQWAADITQRELGELAQFAVYAAQGNDVKFTFNPGDPIGPVLLDWNYKEHYPTEYDHDWPPDFWATVPPFDHVVGPNGEPLEDWRFPIWGGRPV